MTLTENGPWPAAARCWATPMSTGPRPPRPPSTPPFQALITEAAWGHVWARDTISLRERSMLTIALLAGLGNDQELALHIRATANTGASEADVMEALLHVAIYAGVPRANHAIKIAKDTFAEMNANGGRHDARRILPARPRPCIRRPMTPVYKTSVAALAPPAACCRCSRRCRKSPGRPSGMATLGRWTTT